MRKIRKLAALMMAVILIDSLAGCQSKSAGMDATTTAVETIATEAAEMYTPDTYMATVTGMHEVAITVTFSVDAITDIRLDHEETAGIGEPACDSMPGEVLELQGLGIDAVSGVTLTNNTVLEGMADCVAQAGGDVEVLKAVKKEVVAEADEGLTADVVVIGASGAGMAVAVTVSQNGKNVIMIEKTANMGGNAALVGGALNAADDDNETALTRNDSVDFHYQQTMEGGDNQGDPELVRTLVESVWNGVVWLKDLGMQFQDGVFIMTEGMWERAHKPVEPEGSGFFKTYKEYMEGHDGITMKYSTKAENLIVEDGVATGMECTGQTGNKVTVKANNGVVLIAGGFGQNVEMRQKYNEETKLWPAPDETIPSTNTSAITGDGIVMAEATGVELVQMGNIQLLPLDDLEIGGLSGNIEHTVESHIFVNKEGSCLVNEGGRRDEMTLALFEQPDITMYIIIDSNTYPTDDKVSNLSETINSLVAAGCAYKADTLEELAAQINAPAENLVKSVREYSRHCLGGDLEGQADELGRTLFTDTNKKNNGINDGPLYAAERMPIIHHTMGDVKINTDTRVIGTGGSVIPGLFAAGEATGDIHGANHLGKNALTDTVIFGRIAGESASAFIR